MGLWSTNGGQLEEEAFQAIFNEISITGSPIPEVLDAVADEVGRVVLTKGRASGTFTGPDGDYLIDVD